AKLWEYAQLGVPIAASRTRPVARVFGDDAVSFFTPQDAGSFAFAVTRLCRDPAAAERQARAARAATAPWVWSRWKGRYFALVEHAARGDPQTPQRTRRVRESQRRPTRLTP